MSDVDAFKQLIKQSYQDYFIKGQDIIIARAPGRLDVMGGFGDYSGATVLEWPLANATLCAAQKRNDNEILIQSLDPNGGAVLQAAFQVADLHDGPLQGIGSARAYFAQHAELSWAAYIIGVLLVLKVEHGCTWNTGFHILISSRVPFGKGVSSSAALEVSCMQVFARMASLKLSATEIAMASQRVENAVVGAPCGLMDQMTSSTGLKDHLMRMQCQPADLQGQIALPKHLKLWGIDSGIRHSVGGADYSSVRIASFMAYRIIAEHCGFPVRLLDKHVEIADSRWNNYLANVSIQEWESEFQALVPEEITGAAFIEAYQATHDRITEIDPTAVYRPRVAAMHPIYEEARVLRFINILESACPDEEDAIDLGAMMYQAHESYNANQIGSDGTDHLVRLVKERGPEQGLYGAKISGGGSGGSVAILARSDAQSIIEEIMQQYMRESGRQAELFAGSSQGAYAFGTLTFQV